MVNVTKWKKKYSSLISSPSIFLRANKEIEEPRNKEGYNDKKEIFVKTSEENYKFMHINILLL